MRGRARWIAAAGAFSVLALAVPATPAPTSQWTRLRAPGIDGFLFVPENQHTYVLESDGLVTYAEHDYRVLELDRDALVVRRSPSLGRPSDLVLDGNTLWVSVFEPPEIVALARSDLSVQQRYSLAPYTEIGSLVKRGNRIYFSYGCSSGDETGAGSIDLDTELVREYPQMEARYCPVLEFIDPVTGRLVTWTPITDVIRTYDETLAGPVPVDELAIERIHDLDVAPDATTAIALQMSRMTKVDLDPLEALGTVDVPEASSDTAFTPDGSLVASAGGGHGEVVIHRTSDLRRVRRIPDAGGDGGGVALFRDATKLLLSTVGVDSSVVYPRYVQDDVASTRVWETDPVASAEFEAWAGASLERRRWIDVRVRRRGGAVRKVNPPGTQGWPGSIDGNRLIYQQVRGRRSDVMIYDLSSRRRRAPRGVNTPAWEWRPSLSGRWILFGRTGKGGDTAVILHDARTGRERVLDRRPRSALVLADQVNGDHAVWTVCLAECTVFHHHIPARRTRPVRTRWASVFGASVTSGGTLYYGKSGRGCGQHAGIVRDPPSGPPRLILQVPPSYDVDRTHVQPDSGDPPRIYFTRYACTGLGPDPDIYSFRDP